MEMDPDLLDQRVYLHDVRWDDYQHLLRMRGEKAVPRITYVEGEVELMTPSWQHEWTAATLQRLLDTWSDVAEVGLTCCGHWTLQDPRCARGVDPDACYVVGEASRPRPDLAIEVECTPDGIDRLDAYAGLAVAEVWLWQSGEMRVQVLRQSGYRSSARSELLPGIDVAELASFVEGPSQPQAVRQYRTLLQQRLGRC